jgi:phosphoenolpyruvate carboxykinase (GTP)
MAATMGSETTAAAVGQQGVVRRDPFAMLPFCGYNMAEYFEHWLSLGNRLQNTGTKLPKIFCVNWFRTDENGKFVWPGFSDNTRVLKWMLGRIEGDAQGSEHVFGITPRYEDIDWSGMDFSADKFKKITSIDVGAWKQEFKLHDELFEKLAHGLPAHLLKIKAAFESRLS